MSIPITKFKSFPTFSPYPKIYDLAQWASSYPYLLLLGTVGFGL